MSDTRLQPRHGPSFFMSGRGPLFYCHHVFDRERGDTVVMRFVHCMRFTGHGGDHENGSWSWGDKESWSGGMR